MAMRCGCEPRPPHDHRGGPDERTGGWTDQQAWNCATRGIPQSNLNVASLVAYQPGAPRIAAYYATKAYVLSLSKGLARELAGSGVSVTVLASGPTDTSFDDRSGSNANVLYKRLPKMTAASLARDTAE